MRLLAQAALLDTAAEGVAVVDADGRYAFVNARLAELLGEPAEALVGRHAVDVVAEEARPQVIAALERRRGGVIEQLDLPLRRRDGNVVWVLLATSPIFDDQGRYVGALGTLTDVTERRRVEEAWRILADATATLSQSLDYEVTLANVAHAVVPRLGEACSIQLVERAGLHSVAVAAADSATAALLEPGAAKPLVDRAVASRVALTGRGESLEATRADPQAPDAAPGADEGPRPAFGGGASLVVPMKVREETLGVLTLWSSKRSYGERDRELVEEIASRAAMAVDHARLFRAVESQRARLRVIADTSRALAAQLDFNEVAGAIAQVLNGGVVVGLTSADAAERDVLTVRACASTDPGLQQRLQPLLGARFRLVRSGAAERVLRSGDPHIGARESDSLEPPFAALVNGREDDGHMVLAPLVVRGRAIGVMAITRGPGSTFPGSDEIGLVREIADRAAVAFERARLFAAQQRATERLRLLADAGTLLGQSLELDPSLTTLARLAVGWFSDACSVDVVDQGHLTSIAVAAREPALEQELGRAIRRYDGVCFSPPALKRVLDSRCAQLVPHVDVEQLRGFALDDDHLASLVRLGFRSMLVVPLVARGGAFGVMSLARTHGAPYDEDDLALAEELGRRAALAIDNTRLFKRATEAIAARDEFLAIASHELNTPLTPLKMQLDSLRRGKFAPDRVSEKLDAASRQVNRLAKLVSQLLDVSRISGGRMHIEPEALDLAALVDEVVARMADQAAAAASSLCLRVDRPCVGSWDRLRMDQVVTNLLTNAIKYGAGKPIDVELTNRGTTARLVVRDRGIGIAPEHQRRIFERFERAASVRHYGGFGLGLWIARQIVEASGGSITVQSTPGQGSTFSVELPLTAPAIRPDEPRT
ncbi:MAG TPA: ATP-binding protein [Polyangiaceae bacterium]|nr:ATP-binding protein [Polyangiaceae bacterium]